MICPVKVTPRHILRSQHFLFFLGRAGKPCYGILVRPSASRGRWCPMGLFLRPTQVASRTQRDRLIPEHGLMAFLALSASPRAFEWAVGHVGKKVEGGRAQSSPTKAPNLGRIASAHQGDLHVATAYEESVKGFFFFFLLVL